MKNILIISALLLTSTASFANGFQCFKMSKQPEERQSLNGDLTEGKGVFYIMNENTFEISEEGWYQIGFLNNLKSEKSEGVIHVSGSGLDLNIDINNKLEKCFEARANCYNATFTLNPAIKDIAQLPLKNAEIACRITK